MWPIMKEFTEQERTGSGQAGSFTRHIESLDPALKVVGFAEYSSVDEICRALGFQKTEKTTNGQINGFPVSLVIGKNDKQELIKIYESAGILVTRNIAKK